uniref:Uncharacterized protein n=1 Tax=Solanum tuberosum TaxID=4113 RepID=M1DZ16_SOLTU
MCCLGKYRGPELPFSVVEGRRSLKLLLRPQIGVEVEVVEDQVRLEFITLLFQDTLLKMLGVLDNFSQGGATGQPPVAPTPAVGALSLEVILAKTDQSAI